MYNMSFDYFIDSHCHIHDKDFFDPNIRNTLIQRALEKNIKKMILIGTDHEDSLAARDFANSQDKKHEILFWSYGVHPSEWKKNRPIPDFKTNKPIAIGEVGLDYHFFNDNDDIPAEKAGQKQLFTEMLCLAEKYDLPVIFHVREAFDDFFEIIHEHPSIRGVVHSFSDNKKNLKRILSETNFYVGVNGLSTYSTLPTPPIERILLETDAPFLAPVPFRGETNEPAYIYNIAEWLAKKLKLDLKDIQKITTKNAFELFSFDKK